MLDNKLNKKPREYSIARLGRIVATIGVTSSYVWTDGYKPSDDTKWHFEHKPFMSVRDIHGDKTKEVV